jgi:hypothetical protein
MSRVTGGKRGGVIEDLLMVALCSITSFWLLAGLLLPGTLDLGATSGMLWFSLTVVALAAALSAVGVALNHMVARNARVTLRRRRE